MFYRKYGKRIMDFTLALIVTVVLSPIFMIVALCVRLKLGSPIIFKQIRPGLNEKLFVMYKFRTMKDDKDDKGELLPDTTRLTEFGCFLRSTSLDELPGLWNIIKGDMSIVGPRPLLVEYLPYYNAQEKRRHEVRPGLTGLAQINGRNLLMWDARLRKDVDYVNTFSFYKDIHIILKTFIKVLKRQDIATDTSESEGNLAEIRNKNTQIDSNKV